LHEFVLIGDRIAYTISPLGRSGISSSCQKHDIRYAGWYVCGTSVKCKKKTVVKTPKNVDHRKSKFGNQEGISVKCDAPLTDAVVLRSLSTTRKEQELSYRQHIARKLRTQYAEGICRLKYYTVTLKSRSRVNQGHWKRNHWISYTTLLVVELFDVEYYCDLEIWLRGHSRS